MIVIVIVSLQVVITDSDNELSLLVLMCVTCTDICSAVGNDNVGRVEIARFVVVSLQDAIYSIGREPSQ